MVMILTKTRENKGADSITCRTELHTPKMSQGPTLFSCGVMENDRWRDLSRKCPLQLEQPGTNIWDCLSDKGEESLRWPRDTTSTCSVTNLIKDLSLSDPHGNPSAPPSKRQCRSLSFSDEMSSCGTSWRPLGSKPCVLNDKKMTQNRQTFNSLTCLSAAAEDGSQRLPGPQPWTAAPRSPEVMPGRTPACTPVPEPPRSRADEHRASRDDLSCEEEEDGGGKEEDGARSASQEEPPARLGKPGTGTAKNSHLARDAQGETNTHGTGKSGGKPEY
ncbi:protein FAM53B [Patagioenas fasciata monilis]|uniref:Protein FAM53B n=1 Tax=Patagioenas fasciata monilis TaxID=372326 RepID=A0A1V4KHZ4_PATFA|nr:protein FAM53B [Patagioenas fasciata monilis]